MNSALYLGAFADEVPFLSEKDSISEGRPVRPSLDSPDASMKWGYSTLFLVTRDTAPSHSPGRR